MKLQEIMKVVEQTNKLRSVLNTEKAYIELYIDDEQIGKEFYTKSELMKEVKKEYINSFWKKLLEVDFIKTYNNTLSAIVKICDIFGYVSKYKVDLFIDC